MNEEEAIRVQLARMEGKQDVTNERLDTANRINEERHAAIKAQIQTIDTRINSHGERLTGLETREHERNGERKGITMSGKLVGWGLSLLIGAGGGAALLELLR